ncbi:MAG: aconitate hydratase [Bdellovibrionales bacterium]
MKKKLSIIKSQHSKPLTLSEKILFSHLFQPDKFQGSGSFLSLNPDRVIMQDATAQMAMLQFMLTGQDSVAVPSTIHCDHLIIAKQGLKEDMKSALISNQEVYDFLSSVSSRYNIGFWKPGSGIIHQVVLENYAFPGSLIIGTDSHTPNAGGLGVLAIGVGGADATDVMAGFPWEVKRPQITGVHLTGSLSGWSSSKDVILKLLGILTVKGGTNKIIEYFGEGCNSISCTGKATITNMGAELGATCSVFPYDEKMKSYLQATYRKNVVVLADQYKELLTADPEVLEKPSSYYDEVIEINLSQLEPHVCGPHSPDLVRPISKLKKEIQDNKWDPQLSAALIGSCTNSSYEDLGRASHVAQQAAEHEIKMPQPFLVTPGSELVKKTTERDGFMGSFDQVGAQVLANACGPCIGQWQRPIKKGETNTIINSFNRNFKGRNDANPNTLSFIASPEIVMAIGLAGRLDFNPETDSIKQDGKSFQFKAPVAKELPEKDFVVDTKGYVAPQGSQVKVQIKENSERLARLEPFSAWDGKDFEDLFLLCKARGKCTTDHISPAGFWLKYRGHLDKISDNLLIGAVNDYTGQTGRTLNLLSGKEDTFSAVARDYKSQGKAWIIVGDENYGEGSSREHAAMTPRHLGARAVIVKSFARIHETNLKKQGVLPFVFVDKSDYKKIQQEDRISIKNLSGLKPGSTHTVVLKHKDGNQEEISVKHSLNEEQIKWFKAGSSLNTFKT